MEAADVLVIGGGLVGCAAAWHLARGGASVLLAEQGELNSGASGQNAGSLHFQIERRFLENGDAMADQAARVISLNRLAIDEWRGLETDLGRSLDITMAGGLMVAETDDDLRLLEAKAAREAAYALPTRLIDGDAARTIAPCLAGHIKGASFLADEGHANPRIITRAFADAAAGAGAMLSSGCRLVSLERRRAGFVAEMLQGERRRTLRAGAILVAAGAWTAHVGALANLHLPIFPVGLQMNVTERAAPFLQQLIQHVGRRLSMKQAHDGNVLIGGGWPARLEQRPGGGFDLTRPPRIDGENLAANLRIAADVVPAVAGLALIRTWTGIVAITADQLPLVGAVPKLPGFHVAAGGSGFTLGPTFARLIAGQILGQDDRGDDRLAMFAPSRFDHLNGFMG